MLSNVSANQHHRNSSALMEMVKVFWRLGEMFSYFPSMYKQKASVLYLDTIPNHHLSSADSILPFDSSVNENNTLQIIQPSQQGKRLFPCASCTARKLLV